MNNLRKIAQNFKQNFLDKVNVFENEPLSKHDSFKVGGAACLFVEPLTTDAFFDVLNFLESEKVSYFILGGGTNTVFADSGFDGVVVTTVKLNQINFLVEENDSAKITCECGALMNLVVNFATQNCLSGIEEFCGLPGTVGGATFMNARCFNKEMSDVIDSVEYFEKVEICNNSSAKNGDDLKEKSEILKEKSENSSAEFHFVKKSYKFDASDWDYKKSPFSENLSNLENLSNHLTKNKKIISKIILKSKKIADTLENQQKIKSVASTFMAERVEKGHFKFPSAGSVFKNNHAFGAPTGKIVDDLGLKGKKIGGAQIAPFHGNIIINVGGATCSDIKSLVEYVKSAALEKFNFTLEEEIIFVS